MQSSHQISYGCQIWAQFFCSVTECQFYKKNAVRIMTYFKAQGEPLFKKMDILKFKDNIVLS